MTIDWINFTPVPSLLGGALIGLGAAMLALLLGRIAGISGIVAGLLKPFSGDIGWRIAFVAGMLLAPLAYVLVTPLPPIRIDASWSLLVVAGLLVGVGTRYGSGCTSGHAVCGLSRLSPRSMVATASFMAFGFLTVFIVRHVIGG
ncbi:YeeE/YedE family protein [Lacisediminimonas sp.]|uniref:YeeE/YedE family protein n=1 Tax=Lacisediminimonas sp. TaxID=3060582 RepID=UPI0027159B97|nr:YeeE/YedE family protein [Lacisediminimonas sp.]MDO8299513.1 YeeE/YedE family protein [Lacisediminimonas sp.]MDO9216967.1 YeeE/YedE family protein [Lacisediminimonas sp.]